LLLSKLKGDADGRYKYGITTVAELIDVLKSRFGNRQMLLDCYQDLKDLGQEQGEDILRYVKRTETLLQDIIEAEIHEKGSITDIITSEITNKISIAFRKGLLYEIQTTLQYISCLLLSNLLTETIKVTREHERKMQEKDKQYTNPGKRSAWGTGNRGTTSHNSRDPQHYATRAYTNNDIRNSKFCRYCKKLGHEIENCRKKEYNNACNNGNNMSGNSQNLPIPLNGRREVPTASRPVKVIESTNSKQSELQN